MLEIIGRREEDWVGELLFTSVVGKSPGDLQPGCRAASPCMQRAWYVHVYAHVGWGGSVSQSRHMGCSCKACVECGLLCCHRNQREAGNAVIGVRVIRQN